MAAVAAEVRLVVAAVVKNKSKQHKKILRAYSTSGG